MRAGRSLVSAARSRAFRHVGLGAFDLVTRRHVRAEYAWLMGTQELPRPEIEALQREQLGSLFEHAHTHSPFYRARLEGAGWTPGMPAGREVLAALPPLEKQDLQESLDEVSATPRWDGGRPIVSSTGGTTGVPTTFKLSMGARDRRVAAMLRNQTWIGLEPGDPVAYLGGSSLGVPRRARALERAKWAARGQLFLPAWDLSDAALEDYANRLERFRPRLLIGYSGALNTFACYLERSGRSVPVGAVLATAEMLFDPWRSTIAAAFGAPVYQRYGTRELGDIAHSCEGCGNAHMNDENLIVEVDPDTSELYVTDLSNYATPFIRYRVGDSGAVGPGEPGCRPGLGVLQSLEGRTMDVLDLPGGGRVSAVILVHSLKEFPEIRQHQLWQPSPDRVQLLVASPDAPPADSIRRTLQPHFPDVRIEILWVDEIPTNPNAKLSFVIPNREYSGEGVPV